MPVLYFMMLLAVPYLMFVPVTLPVPPAVVARTEE